jgi:Arc/MetJ-type ribon-helix-helix transcriptional regulator
MEQRIITVRMPESVAAKIELLAESAGATIPEFIRRACANEIERGSAADRMTAMEARIIAHVTKQIDKLVAE